MAPLEKDLRKLLETTEEAARESAERAVQAVFGRLALTEMQTPDSLKNDSLRLQLRERARQLGRGYAEGDATLQSDEAVRKGVPYLREELAYEIWHRMLFARFLAENDLLIHPVYKTPVSIADCAQLAEESTDGKDAWDLAADFAAARLPGLFAASGLSARLTLAPEEKQSLESLIERLPGRLFLASDALGWVYQYWQGKKKAEVNASERKIGGADLSAVTQLFTEDYMVRFLLENTLGAWWSVHHSESPLLKGWKYLRFREPLAASLEPLGESGESTADSQRPAGGDDEDVLGRVPAAGRFETWPETVKEVTVIDPCCGSGHFLVAAFEMLRKMRMEEEGLSASDAANAVLRDNLFGLELDPRCTQIATFAVALAAWQVGGEPERYVPHIACSGTPVKGQLADWTRKFGRNDDSLVYALEQLHALLKDAPTLGSLIDREAVIHKADLWRIDWDKLVDVIEQATALQRGDTEISLFGDAASSAAKAANLLGKTYTLVATNVPYLKRGRQNEQLRTFCLKNYPNSRADVATVFIERSLRFLLDDRHFGSLAVVSPQNWLFLGSYTNFRKTLLETATINVVARLGTGAFDGISGEVVNVSISVLTAQAPSPRNDFVGIEASAGKDAREKDLLLQNAPLSLIRQIDQFDNPDARVLLEKPALNDLLSKYATSYKGLCTGDSLRFVFNFWELPSLPNGWKYEQGTIRESALLGGMHFVFRWGDGEYEAYIKAQDGRLGGSWKTGSNIWGSKGVIVSQMSALPTSLYLGDVYDNNTAVIVPIDAGHLPAIWAFCSAPEFNKAVRRIDTALKVTNASLVKVPFDLAHWQKVADEQYPNGLSEPHSDDPTQWLFNGTVPGSDAPLQVAVARLLGYRWPEQVEDGLNHLIDADGIICLPAVGGEQPADARLRTLLGAAYGAEWSGEVLDRLLAGVAAPDLVTWLRDKKGFFAKHTRLFHNRPFIWQISDGARDGFSALINYHKLTPAALQKLIYTYLGDWIKTQRGDAEREVAGAPDRLAKALELQAKLIAIAEGEPPYDIYVRWKSLAEQPIGWNPDLNDGVRLNIRPFLTAGILHAPFSINWNKDRGKDPVRPVPDLSAIPRERREEFEKHYSVERWNDLHFTVAEKQAARASTLDNTTQHANATSRQPRLLNTGTGER